MKHLKPWIACVSLIGSLAVSTLAQTPAPTSRPATPAAEGDRLRPARFVDAYGELLGQMGLSTKQADQVRDLLRQARVTFRNRIAESDDLPPRERVEVLRNAMADLDAKINKLLDEPQRKTFAEQSETLRNRMRDQLRREAEAPPKPATRPAFENRPGAPMAGRVERAVVGLGLSDDQRVKIYDEILDPARYEIDAMVQEATAAGVSKDEIAMRVRRIVMSCNDRIVPILTTAQRDRYRRAFDTDRPLPAQPTMGDAMAGGTMMGGTMAGDSMAGGINRPGVARVPTPATLPAAPKIELGASLPPIPLKRLDGRPFNERLLVGKPVVFIFGSLTAPSFRDRMPRIAALADSYSSNVVWIVIYTREMHPGLDDVPARNLDDKIAIADHMDYDARVDAAKLAKSKLSIPFEIMPDAMDNAFTDTFGGFPNGAAIFDANGKLVALERWAEPFAIKRALDAARSKP